MCRKSVYLKCVLFWLVSVLWAQDMSLSLDTVQQCYTIKALSIVGNKRTKVRAIAQEMRLKVDSTYCSKDWEKLLNIDQEWIYGMGLFDTVQVSLSPLPEVQTANIEVHLKERWYIYPFPVLQVSQYSFGYWWRQLNRDPSYLSYGMGLSYYNPRGLDDKLFMMLQFGNGPVFDLRYKGPYTKLRSGALFGYGLRLLYARTRSLIYENRAHNARDISLVDDFLYTQGRGTLNLYYRPRIDTEHSLFVGASYQHIADTLKERSTHFLYPSGESTGLQLRSLNLFYTFELDRRKQPRYSLEGYYLRLQLYRYGLGVFSERNLTRLRLRYAKYLPLSKQWYLSTLLRSSFSVPLQQAYADYEELNLGTEVRGYHNYFIQGPLMIHSNVLLKKQLLRWELKAKKQHTGIREYFSYLPFTLYGYVYVNGAWARRYPRENSLRLNDKVLYSIGPGLELLTWGDFVLGFFYALTRHGKNPGFYVNVGGGN